MKINNETGNIHEGTTGPELTEKYHPKEKNEASPEVNPFVSKKDDGVIIEKINTEN